MFWPFKMISIFCSPFLNFTKILFIKHTYKNIFLLSNSENENFNNIRKDHYPAYTIHMLNETLETI